MGFLATPAQARFIVLSLTVFSVVSLYLGVTHFVNYMLMPLDYADKISERIIEIDKVDARMSYGSSARPAIDGITLSSPLPQEYVPTLENKRRLLVVGDIHGMLDPLDRLLKEADFDPKRDHLVAVGDMINKGPKSAGVVARLMSLKASAVRGNHEDRVLLAWDNVQDQQGVEAAMMTVDLSEAKGVSDDLATARSLSQQQLSWIKGLPLVLTVDPMSLYVVHAGLVPGLPVDRQDPWAVMNMRSIRYPREEYRKEEDDKQKEKDKQRVEAERKVALRMGAKYDAYDATAAPNDEAGKPKPTDGVQHIPDRDVWVPSEKRDGDSWTEFWNRVQRGLEPHDRRFVVYGHDAKRGYREDTYTFGLDSNCVKGGALTGLVLEATPSGWNHTTVQVMCEQPKNSWW